VRHLDDEPEVALERIVELHKRHGAAVSEVIDAALNSVGASPVEPNSLLALYRADQLVGGHPSELSSPPPAPSSEDASRTWTIRLDRQKRVALIDGVGEIRNTGFKVLNTLAEKHLEAKGMGLEPEDFPFSKASKLQSIWGLKNEDNVRKRISLLRRILGALCTEIGYPPPEESEIVETQAWHGYRLNPDHVTIFITHQAKLVRTGR